MEQMNNSEVEALLDYKEKLRNLILNNENADNIKKYKSQIELIDDLLFYDRYTKGER